MSSGTGRKITMRRLSPAIPVALLLLVGCRGAVSLPRPASVVRGDILTVWNGDLNGDGRPDRVVITCPKGQARLGGKMARPTGFHIWLRSRKNFEYIYYRKGLGAFLPSRLGGAEEGARRTVGPLSFQDINRNGNTNICFIVWDGGNNPGYEAVLEVRGLKIWEIFRGTGSRLADLDKDGVPEIVGPLEMGWRSMCILPTGVWKWRNDRYELANGDFGNYLHEKLEEARALGEKYPEDLLSKTRFLSGHLSLGDRESAKRVADEIRAKHGEEGYSGAETDIRSAFECAEQYLGGEGRPPRHQERKEFVGGYFEAK